MKLLYVDKCIDLHHIFYGRVLAECLARWPLLQLAWRRHKMETFSALLALCEGNLPVTGGFPSQRPLTGSFDVIFDLLHNKRSMDNCEAGDLRRHRARYDVTVMEKYVWLRVLFKRPGSTSYNNSLTAGILLVISAWWYVLLPPLYAKYHYLMMAVFSTNHFGLEN